MQNGRSPEAGVGTPRGVVGVAVEVDKRRPLGGDAAGAAEELIAPGGRQRHSTIPLGWCLANRSGGGGWF